MADGAALGARTGKAFVTHLDGAGFGRIAHEVASVFEVVEVGLDSCRGLQADRLADLTHRRGVAPVVLMLDDAVEDFSLSSGECVGHGDLRWAVFPPLAGGLWTSWGFLVVDG